MLGRVILSLLVALGAGLLGIASPAGAAAPLADVTFVVGLSFFLVTLFVGPKELALRRNAVRIEREGGRPRRR